MNLSNYESIAYSYPELILMTAAIVIFLADLVVRNKEHLGSIALFGCAFALLAAIGLRVPFSETWLIHGLLGWGEGWLYSRMVVVDDFAVFFKIIFCLAAFATVWMSLGSNEVRGVNEGEYYGLVLASTVGMLYMASAANLLMAYLSLEFVSLTSYVLTGYMRHNRRSGEAALKYLIYGGVASGTMIYSATRSRRCPSTCGRPTCTPARRSPSPHFSRSARKRRGSRSSFGSSTRGCRSQSAAAAGSSSPASIGRS